MPKTFQTTEEERKTIRRLNKEVLEVLSDNMEFEATYQKACERAMRRIK